ncbi:hypothetical protein DACRYDRAFT_49374 [Dacryopinax primogenitus]|uniref:ZZ-type domain-containing protein n=1 Tax=Dacryopinax primogenitus (strain DJM 731) TaxID=1858805 RepID=M5G674_DACPD|nr:uncharacterized protein DACRYDRAFT_49374 [Dacryopinax primogenitus]EJU03700.1 hypothetical protein DACRYDRAFT_49374 [Dacryopinax primogenitus]
MTALSSSSAWDRPDRPLVVKCSYNRSLRRVTFGSAVDCHYDLLRAKVEQCFSLYGSPFLITYMDDDGEVTDISSNHDLTEAINYFSDGDTESVAYSGASSASGRSSSGKKVTLRVKVNMENDGPSLSDTASLASMDEYVQVERTGERREREVPRGQAEPEDDAITVSSHNYGSQTGSSFVDVPRPGYPPSSSPAGVNLPNYNLPTLATVPPSPPASPGSRRFQQTSPFDDQSESAMVTDRLRRLVVADGPVRTEDDIANEDEDPFDDAQLELQRGAHHYYYEYPASQSGGSSGRERDRARRVRDSGMDQTGSVDLESLYISNNQQTSPHGLAWIENQNRDHQQLAVVMEQQHRQRSSPGAEELPLVSDHASALPQLQSRYPGIPAEVLAFVPEEEVESVPAEAPRLLTDCSSCGVLLEDFRYVCTTCGEKEAREPPAWHHLSRKQMAIADAFSAYSEETVQQGRQSGRQSGSSFQMQTFSYPPRPPPVPLKRNSRPGSGVSPNGRGTPGLRMPLLERGYELCAGCVHSAGLNHAAVSADSDGHSPLSSSSTHYHGSQSALQLPGQSPVRNRKKHAFRHAFREKMWGLNGWKDLEYDEHVECATCKNSLPGDRYKCLSCDNFSLCRGCYSQVHHIHPAHVFLFVEVPRSEPLTPSLNNALVLSDRTEPESESPRWHLGIEAHVMAALDHPGVKCTHCLQDIVGARFHCAICSDVDICANCEAAGLPGNLTAPDGGHDDSHIMIKIPYPLDPTQVEAASRRARNLWSQRDGLALDLAFPRQRANSSSSDSLPTVIGAIRSDEVSQHIICKGCDELIEGVRYQCAHCPSLPESYNLCSMCEARSYDLHDPMHAFFKIPRPLDRAINSPFPILPLLYRSPVAAGFESNQDPRDVLHVAYLNNLVHQTTLCDICVEPIRGEWFRCVYCSKDLCADCEENDVHDPTHIFVVFKAPVDMGALRVVSDIVNPRNSRPLLPYKVYGNSSNGP